MEEHEDSEEVELDEEELEAIKQESMSGLFMSFKIEPPKERKKPPKLPPRGDISEDSMEDMVSQDMNNSIELARADTKPNKRGN